MQGVPDDLLASMQQMQKGLQASHKDLLAMRVVGEGRGLVRITLDGTQKVTQVNVDTSLLTPGAHDLLEACIQEACNDAMAKFTTAVQEAVSRTLSGLNLTELMNQFLNSGPGLPTD